MTPEQFRDTYARLKDAGLVLEARALSPSTRRAAYVAHRQEATQRHNPRSGYSPPPDTNSCGFAYRPIRKEN